MDTRRAELLRFLTRLAALVLPLALLTGGVNVLYYDSSSAYGHSSRYERELAAQMLAGKYLAFDHISAQDFDWRLVRKEYAQLSRARPDVLVLGSSHTSDIHASSFPGQVVVNGAFAGGTYEEDAAIYWIYRKSGLAPARVIIPLDIFMLNTHSQYAGIFGSIEGEYAEFADAMGLPQRTRLFDAFNLAHFQAALGVATGQIKLDDAPHAYHAAANLDTALAGLLPDGSLFLAHSPPALQDKRVADSVALKKDSWFRGFTAMDTNEQQVLERLLALLARDHVQMLLYLPPTHPLFYATYHTPAYPLVDAAQRYYEALAEGSGLALLGSYDPAACGMVAADFDDGDHLTDEGLAKVLRAQRCYKAP